jgi:PAS domain S-box-containing protein
VDNKDIFEEMVQSVNSIIMRWSIDFKVTFINDYALHFYGYTREELIGKSIIGTIVPETSLAGKDLGEMLRDISRKPERYISNENENVRKNGERVWVSWTNKAIYDQDGRLVDILAVGLDITERKMAEAELERTNRALKAISRCNEAMVHAGEEYALLKDICNIIVEVGGYRMAWIGYAIADEAKTVRPMAKAGYEYGYVEKTRVTWADTERGRDPAGTAVRTKKPFVIKYVTTDPNFVPWRDESLRMGYNSVIGLPLVIDDFTPGVLTIYSENPDAFDKDEIIFLQELADNLAYGIISIRSRRKREQAEEKLRLSEERFRATFEQAAVGVVHTGIDGHFMRVNQKMCDITGYSREELLELTYMEITFPDDIEKDLVNTKKLVDGLIQTYSTEKRYIRKDGSLVQVNITSSLFSKNGQPQYYITIVQDITERKRAEEALRVNEARLRRTRQILYRSQEAGKVGSWFLDLKSNYLWWSPETYKMYGISPGTRLDYESFLATVHEEDRESVDRAWKAALAGATYDIEHRVLVGGNIKWMQEKAILEFDEKGVPVSGIGTVLDITDRKLTEEALRLTQFSVDRVAEMAIWVAQDASITYVNEAACKVFGYTREEFLTKKTFDTNPFFNENNWGDHWKDIMERGAFTFEAILRKKDGSLFPAEISVNYLVYEGREYNCSYVRDITERKRAEEEMRAREAKLDSILRAAPVGIGVVVDRTIKEANKRLCEMTGYLRDELIGRDALLLYPSDVEYHYVGQEKYRQIAEYGTGSVETRWKCKDGRIINILLSSTPIDIKDLSAGITFTALDITERKEAEEALKEAKDQAELYVDLMGHDINNMNQIAAGFLELAINKLDHEGRLDKTDRMFLEKPIETLMKNSQLIDNVRKIKKEKSGEIKPILVDIDGVLRDVADQYSHISGREVTINYIPVSGCRVMANELLKDVFMNIVGNAIKHSSGPLEINIVLSKLQKQGREYYRVDVEDNGPGIPDKMKKKLLDHACLKRTLKTGKGFGLCLIKTLLDDFQGSIWIEDRVPADFTKGSKFIVMLPAAQE